MTAGHRAIVEPQLRRTGLGELLPVRVLATTCPSTSPIRRRCAGPSSCSTWPTTDEVAYVGDAPTDMRMARAVGVRAVGIASVVGDPDELIEAGADEVAATVAELGRGRRPRRPRERTGRPAIVLADGDAPDRAALDATWPGWDATWRSSSPRTAVRGTRRARARIDRWVGDGDSLPAADLDALRAGGVRSTSCPPTRTRPTRSSRSGRRRRGRVGGQIVGALGGPRLDHALANVALLAHPALGGRRPSCSTVGRGCACCAARDAGSPARPATSCR